MPDRRSPGSGWLVAAHIVLAIAGMLGIAIIASPSVQAVLGPIGIGAVWLWSGVFTIAGTLAAFARLLQRYRAEATAVDMLAAAVALWGGMVLYVATYRSASIGAGTQIGVGLIAAALFMHGWARHRRAHLAQRQRVLAAARQALMED